MRNTYQSTHSVVSSKSSEGNPVSTLRLCNESQVNIGHAGDSSDYTTRNRFSQKSKSSTMLENTSDAIAFVNEQAKVLHNLVKQFQLYVGYREQLGLSDTNSASADSWGVYLMYVQSIHDTMHQSFRGKPLFGDGISPAIRIHVESTSHKGPFDLPDPCLISMIGVRSFLSGITDHRLPSVKLGNICIKELINALNEVYICRDKLSEISRALLSRKLPVQSTESVKLRSCDSQWFSQFKNIFASIFGPSRSTSGYLMP